MRAATRLALGSLWLVLVPRVAAQQVPDTVLPRPGALRAGLAAVWGSPLGTMAAYFPGAYGLAVTVRGVHDGPVSLRADAEYLRFAERTVARPYAGSGPLIDITSAATVVLVSGGAELRVIGGGTRFVGAVRAAAALAYVGATGATGGLGTDQTVRASTFTTVTWGVAGGVTLGFRLAAGPAAPRLELSSRVVALGRCDFLREYNLPIGVISGLYAKPTPYRPSLAAVSLGLSVPT